MPEPSLAETFFNQVTTATDPIAFLTSLVDPSLPRFEEEWLDFKQAPDIKSLDVTDNWSTSLSGFANTGGGVLVWGIRAKKDPTTGIDCAIATALIDNPAALKSRLMELHHLATDPPVQGVKVEQYTDPATGRGFVVCLIPASGFRPHRAEHVKNRPYYIRAGDDFVVAPVAVLKAMFYPRSSPVLLPEIRPTWQHVATGNQINYELRLRNAGTATAREVYLELGAQFTVRITGAAIGWTAVSIINRDKNGYESGKPHHPGTETVVCTVHEIWAGGSPFASRRFMISIYSGDHQPQAFEVRLREHDILNGLAVQGTPLDRK